VNIPFYSDAESNPITLTTVEQGHTTLPNFITFADPQFSIMPTLISQVGTHIIECKICDGGNLCSTLTFNVIVLNNLNTAPVINSGILQN